MKTPQRIRLFIFGFLFGCVMVYFVLFRGRDRSYWLPENRVKGQLMKGSLVFSEHAICKMKCRTISEEEVRDILKNGDVNFGESHPRDTVCPSYAIDGITQNQKNVRIVFAANDTLTTRVITAIDLGIEKDTCDCGSPEN